MEYIDYTIGESNVARSGLPSTPAHNDANGPHHKTRSICQIVTYQCKQWCAHAKPSEFWRSTLPVIAREGLRVVIHFCEYGPHTTQGNGS